MCDSEFGSCAMNDFVTSLDSMIFSERSSHPPSGHDSTHMMIPLGRSSHLEAGKKSAISNVDVNRVHERIWETFASNSLHEKWYSKFQEEQMASNFQCNLR